MTLYLIHYLIHYLNSLKEYGQKYNFKIKKVCFENLLLNFLNASHPPLMLRHHNHGKIHKIARQEIEGFTRLLKTYISSVKDADLDDEHIFDSFKL